MGSKLLARDERRKLDKKSEKRKQIDLLRTLAEAGTSFEEEMYGLGEESHGTDDDEQFEVLVQRSSNRSTGSNSGTNSGNFEGAKNIGGGGPEDKTLLVSFDCHIARSMWDMKKEHGPLRCISHSRKLRWKLHEVVQNRVPSYYTKSLCSVCSNITNLQESKANKLVEATKGALRLLNANIIGGSSKVKEGRYKDAKEILENALLTVNEAPPTPRLRKVAAKPKN